VINRDLVIFYSLYIKMKRVDKDYAVKRLGEMENDASYQAGFNGDTFDALYRLTYCNELATGLLQIFFYAKKMDRPEQQQEYNKLRSHFQSINLKFFFLIFRELAFFKCGFGFEDSDKIIDFYKKNKPDFIESGSWFCCIPTKSDSVKGSIEIVVFIDKNIRDILQVQCEINDNELVPFKLMAFHVEDDVYTLQGKKDRLIFLPYYFLDVLKDPLVSFYIDYFPAIKKH